MSSLLATIREIIGPPDPRSEREVDGDLDAEFAFHIEQIEAELIEQGVPPEHAPDLARARFGNQRTLKQRCRAIALEERIMLQRINTVLMIIVMLAVIGASIQMYTTQRYNALALQDITAQIATMRIDAAAGGDASAGEGEDSQEPRVLVEGYTDRAGWYPLDPDRATFLHELVEDIGVPPDRTVVLYPRGRPNGRPYQASDLLGSNRPHIVLWPTDRIKVEKADEGAAAHSRPSIGPGYRGPGRSEEPVSGHWREVAPPADATHSAYEITLLGGDDVRNLSRRPIGTLELPNHEKMLTLEFVDTPAMPQVIQITDESDNVSRGRWQLEDGILTVNITPAVEAITEPLHFTRVE